MSRIIALLLSLAILQGCAATTIDHELATVQDLNRVVAALTGRTDLHGGIDSGLESVREKMAEAEAKARLAYDSAIANGASVVDAKKAAEEAGKIGWGAGLGLAATFATGVFSYFRRNQTRVPAMVDTFVAAAKHLGLVNDANKSKIAGLAESCTRTLKTARKNPNAIQPATHEDDSGGDARPA